MKPLILCIRMEPMKLVRVSMLAMSMGIQVKEVKPEQWGQQLGALCGLMPLKKQTPAVSVGGETLVMAFFTDKLLDSFFAAFRKSGLTMPPARAVLTPTNQKWNCGRLYDEIAQEHRTLNAFESMNSRIRFEEIQ